MRTRVILHTSRMILTTSVVRALVVFGSGVLLAATFLSPAHVSADTKDATQGSVQGYAAVSPLQNGTIVQLVDGSTNTVMAVSQTKVADMYGVTVDPNTLLFTISGAGLRNEVYVATSGTYNVLVSNQAGPIRAGDYLTISAVDGVAMDAGTTGVTVLGRAAAPFDNTSVDLGTEQLKRSDGSTQAVRLGLIPVAIHIGHNPDELSTKVDLPKVLQRLGQAIAEKPIGPLRTYLSIGITGASLIIAMVILYSGVRNSLVSIGRNPLSKGSIFRGLITIILSSVLVLTVGLFAVYLLLKL